MAGAVEIKSADAAVFFIRAARAAYRLDVAGFMTVSAERKLELANRIARRIGVDGSARLLARYTGKKSGLSFSGVCCDCCGTPLTNAESVAARRGPKCIDNGATPLARFAVES